MAKIKAKCYLTQKGLFVNFEKFVPGLRGLGGKKIAMEIRKEAIEKGFQVLNDLPVIFVKDIEIIKEKIKGSSFNLEIEILSNFQILKKKILKELGL